HMSKFIFAKYRSTQDPDSVLHKLLRLCDLLSPAGLNTDHLVYENKSCANSFVGIQNNTEDYQEESHLLIGQVNSVNIQFSAIGDDLPDGSYTLIRFNDDYIEFFCDKFCSRTLWYYFDEEKLILSNSQKAIVSLKEAFKLNQATVSWFLSSGSQ